MLRPLRPLISMCTSRHLSFSFFKKNWKSKCENVECDTRPQKKYVVEKSCCNSIFDSWTPKIPELNKQNYPTIQTSMMAPYKHKSCAAGPNKKTRCDIEAMAKERVKMNHPKWIQHCPPIPKNKVLGPVPPLKAGADKCKKKDPPKQESTSEKDDVKEKKRVKSPRLQQCTPQIPASNWNTDGHLS